MCQGTAIHHRISHAQHTAHHKRVLRTYRHAYMHAIHNNFATFLLGRHWREFFARIFHCISEIRAGLPTLVISHGPNTRRTAQVGLSEVRPPIMCTLNARKPGSW